MNNLQFYLNKYPSAPDGKTCRYSPNIFLVYGKVSMCVVTSALSFGTDVYIESFLKEWKNDYKRLERVHSYIQWYVCFDCVQPEITKLMSPHTRDLAARD